MIERPQLTENHRSVEFAGVDVLGGFFDYTEEDAALESLGILDRSQPILDVGSSGSNRVMELRKRGYNAYGIDPHYVETDKVSSTMVGVSFAAMVDGNEYWFIRQRDALDQFQASIRLNGQNKSTPYIAASAAELPFGDASIGTIMDSRFSFQYFDDDVEVLSTILTEYKRVLTPSGIVLLNRWAGIDVNGNIDPNIDPNDLVSTFNDTVEPRAKIFAQACVNAGLAQATTIHTAFEDGPEKGKHKSTTVVLEHA